MSIRTESKWRSPLNESERGNLGADVEPHLEEMSETPVDVELASCRQFELARRVAFVFCREKRRGQKRWLALPTMGVSRENPSPEVSPDRAVHRIGIVAQHQGVKL